VPNGPDPQHALTLSVLLPVNVDAKLVDENAMLIAAATPITKIDLNLTIRLHAD